MKLFEEFADVTARGAVRPALPWIETRPGLPYFVTESGEAWTPIGHNDAITWPELAGLFRRRDLGVVERHLWSLKAHGVTCIRLMLEYCQGEHRYLEKPAGRFVPDMVQLWDDLFALLEKVGLYVLLTPFDTFFTWIRFRHHPYNRRNGGPCSSRRQLLTCPVAREAIMTRFAFASDRWGASPALFAWDLWNEMHPAQAGDDLSAFASFINEVGPWLRARELERHGRAHLQTVSIFGPELIKHPELAEPIFRHPALDFANTHLYESRTIDDPKDTVAPALAVGRLMRAAVGEASDQRPVFDSEHGPIHAFKDKKRVLPDDFDDEYFRHIQWAHLASGGAGGGMRWPNRSPHVLTLGMRRHQRALADFLPHIDWATFRRRNLAQEVILSEPGVVAFACGDASQAIVWLLRVDGLDDRGMLARASGEQLVNLTIPGLGSGEYCVTLYDTTQGTVCGCRYLRADASGLDIGDLPVRSDVALAVRKAKLRRRNS